MVTSSVDPPPVPYHSQQTPSYVHKKSFFYRLHVLCLFLTLGVLGAAGLTIYRYAFYVPKEKKDEFGYTQPDNSALGTSRIWAPIILGILFLAYWIEVIRSPTRKYAFNVLTNQSTLQFIEYVQSQPADLWMSVECYHYETRTRTVTYTDSNGNTQTRTETYQERVVTYSETTHFPYRLCEDVSENLQGKEGDVLEFTRKGGVPLELLNYETTRRGLQKIHKLCRHTMIMVKLTEIPTYWLAENFKDRNRHRDTHMDFGSGMNISGYKERVLSLVDLSKRPFLLTPGWYLFISLLMGSWFYRIWMDNISQRVNFTFVKQISA